MAISRADPSGNDFPLLDEEGWTETSPVDPAYNCIAWAADEERRWWWPGAPPIGYWPHDLPDEPSVAAFEALFAQLGYTPCETSEIEDGFEKVAIYSKEGEVTHAARQLPNGRWTSKLGRNIDIEHTLRGLRGPTYGEVVRIMKRRRSATDS
ncbi:MAG: hypothetical protein CHACPFDD_02561 [Phycisphaerae bacterium]|nr:hypothetical protein [Phycisphaerae bacterium]